MSMTFRSISKVVAVAALSSSIAFGAYAHGGATGIVKERMDQMLGMGQAMKELVTMFKGAKDYDADVVRAAAEKIRDHSGETLTKLFPKDSLMSGSEARPEIWQDWAAFEALSDDLKIYAAALAENAGRADIQGNSAGATGGNTMGAGSMMGGGMMGNSAAMMGGAPAKPSREMVAQMPPQALFGMVTQTCSACHSRFRSEKK